MVGHNSAFAISDKVALNVFKVERARYYVLTVCRSALNRRPFHAKERTKNHWLADVFGSVLFTLGSSRRMGGLKYVF